MAWDDDDPATRSRPKEEILIGLDIDADDADDGLEGYDPSQRAEILEATAKGPVRGDVQIGLVPDRMNWD
ncbi:hypothetical protein [Sphingobium boeckii]|uniref:Uncharacterized protein n=1 Tax=Sphingobium boeckii TaxID=1082345 RepID=A0A7W9AF54_9SPHN|nr:hypothetical protein [Sphingobium boeckii]MBB5684518.1 hypothetical protein [Sphingobium boeckii]